MEAETLPRVSARREFKYLVPRRHLPALRASLGGLCELDPHARDDGRYGVWSLYFDSPELTLFHANEREAPRRFKVRARLYPDSPGSPVFAEVKMRDGDVIRKHRAPLPRDSWADALAPGAGARASSPALEAFRSRLLIHDLRPVTLVSYDREAWISRWDAYARVSIDTRICCQAAHELSLEARGSWRPIDNALLSWTQDSICVVELKWADAAPEWMVGLVQQLELLRHSYSKYCYAMLSLADDHFRDYRRASSTWA